MTQVTRRRRPVAVMLWAAALVCAACGGDGDDVATDTTTAPDLTHSPSTTIDAPTHVATSPEQTDTSPTIMTTAIDVTSAAHPPDVVATADEVAPPTGTPISIGVAYAETGRAAGAYNMSDGVAKAWAEWVNEEMGGVNGHPVEIVVGDDQSTGDGAAAAGRDVVESGAVAVIINDSSAENALADFLAEQGVPNIAGTANAAPADSGESHWPNHYFPLATGSPESIATPMVVAASAGFKNLGAIVCSEVPSCLDADRVYSAIAPGLGIGYAGVVV